MDVDTASYDTWHLPGAIGWNWQSDLQHPLRRDIVLEYPDEYRFAEYRYHGAGEFRIRERVVPKGDPDDLRLVAGTRDGGWFDPNEMLLLPPSAFFIIGFLVWGIRSWRSEQREKPDFEPLPLPSEEER